eukprot:scaffold36788_cov90-Phaeocystis_antarctica.AAC.4
MLVGFAGRGTAAVSPNMAAIIGLSRSGTPRSLGTTNSRRHQTQAFFEIGAFQRTSARLTNPSSYYTALQPTLTAPRSSLTAEEERHVAVARLDVRYAARRRAARARRMRRAKRAAHRVGIVRRRVRPAGVEAQPLLLKELFEGAAAVEVQQSGRVAARVVVGRRELISAFRSDDRVAHLPVPAAGQRPHPASPRLARR